MFLEEILGIQNCFLIPLAKRVVLSHRHGCLETSTNGLLLHAVLMLQRTKTLNKTTTKSVCGPMNQSRPRWKARSLASKCPQEPHLVSELYKDLACREKEADMGWRPSLMKSILLREQACYFCGTCKPKPREKRKRTNLFLFPHFRHLRLQLPHGEVLSTRPYVCKRIGTVETATLGKPEHVTEFTKL